MDEKERQQIRERIGKASPGPWQYVISDEGEILCKMDSHHEIGWDIEGACPKCWANMEFIAHAREDVPKLLDENESLRTLLAEIDWRGYLQDGTRICHFCEERTWDTFDPMTGRLTHCNHAPDCLYLKIEEALNG